MRSKLTNWLAVSLLLLTGNAFAQCTVNVTGNSLVCVGDQPTLTATVLGPANQLSASNTAGNNHRGNMFDIVATNAVTITSFDASPMGSTTIEVYYKVGTWNGFANTPSAWTLLTTVPVTYTGGFVNVPLSTQVTIPAGQTYGFYVTSNNTGISLNYSNGTGVGNVYASDANISFLEGGGMEYPFTQNTGAVYQPRVWNGMIHYSIPNTSGTTFLWGNGATTASIQPTITTPSVFAIEATTPGCPTMYDTLNINTSVPVVSAGGNQTICMGDDVLLHATGAETYAWDNGVTDSIAFTPTVAGMTTYTVIGTDSIGCTDTVSVDVSVYDLPQVNAGQDLNVCEGNDAILAGQGALNYSWDNGITDNVGFTPVTDMQYVVTGTDVNGCVDTDTMNLFVRPLPNVGAGADQEVCYGTDIVLNGSGAMVYQWTNGVQNGTPFVAPVGTTTYIVVGLDMYACADSDTVTVLSTEVAAPIQLNGTTLVTSPNPNGTFQWYNCDLQQNIAGETGLTYTPTVTGNYAVIVTDTVNGCDNMSDCMLVDFTAVGEHKLNAFNLYPNPTSGLVTITASSVAIDKIQVMDLVGKIIFEANPNLLNTTIDLSSYEGKQFVVAIYSENTVEVIKVLKF